MLYTPIAVRVVKQGSADGLSVSTWWLKLTAYTFSNIYFFKNAYPVSTYIETLTTTVQVGLLLPLVVHYQKGLDGRFAAKVATLGAFTAWCLAAAPMRVVAATQLGYTVLNMGAIVPQLVLNYRRGNAGDYSPLTAILACVGASIRLFTTMRLAGGDPLLLLGFVISLSLNSGLLGQILFYSTVKEGKGLLAVLTGDFTAPNKRKSSA